MKFRIQPGRTYLTRDGQRVYVEIETKYPGHWRMRCIDEATGALTWRARNGKFDGHPNLDLRTEVGSKVRYPRWPDPNDPPQPQNPLTRRRPY